MRVLSQEDARAKIILVCNIRPLGRVNLIILHQQSVVIVGAMNPAIHHPAWYHSVSIITQEEFDASLLKPVLVNQQIAQFAIDGFSVLCFPDRWQASCDAEDGSRIIEVTKATFEKLYHTPISAYGVNHDFHVETTKQIHSTLGAIVRKTGLPFPPDEVATATLTYTVEASGNTFKTTIAPSPRGPNFLHIQNNAHFIIQESNPQFDLGPLLDEAIRKNEDRSQLMLSSLVDAIQGQK
jgi:hypothetical protein